MEKLKAAVIGLGIGKHHAMVLSNMDNVDLVAVADKKEHIVSHLSTQLNAEGYCEGQDLLRNHNLDFVCLCVPPSVHPCFTAEAAERGVHIFCEKPMAPDLAACDKMINACEENDVQLMVGHKKRFSPTFQFVKQQSEGEFGAIRWANLRYACGRVDMDWVWEEEDGGGPLLENSVHVFDMLRYLVGEVQRVTAEGGNVFNPAREPQLDTAAVSLKFQSGAMASVACGQACEWGFAHESSCFAHEHALVELRGTFDNPEHLHYVKRSNPDNTHTVDRPEHDLFAYELEHFTHCLEDSKPPLIDGREGRKAVEISLAVKESIRSGETVVLNE